MLPSNRNVSDSARMNEIARSPTTVRKRMHEGLERYRDERQCKRQDEAHAHLRRRRNPHVFTSRRRARGLAASE